jgi:enoyl-CoA hydratase
MAGIEARREGQALVVTLRRPEHENKIDRATMDEISAAFDSADSDPSVRCVVLTGSSGFFCTGGQIDGFPGGAADPQLAFARAFTALQARMRQSRVPVVAAVNGHCLAGGMSLLAACDVAVAAEDVRFGFPEINAGLFPMLAMAVARYQLPPKVLFELFYTGKQIDAVDALALHLVTAVVPPGQMEDAVSQWVEALTAKSATALCIGRRAYAAMESMNLGAALEYAETTLVALLASEGVSADFMARQPS